MSSPSEVSVVLATRNRCQFLQAALASVLDQSFRRFEVIRMLAAGRKGAHLTHIAA